MIKKEELVGKNSYGFIYRLVTRESEDNVHRLFADVTVVYLGLQSTASIILSRILALSNVCHNLFMENLLVTYTRSKIFHQ